MQLVNKCLELAKQEKYDQADVIAQYYLYPFFVGLTGENTALSDLFFYSTNTYKKIVENSTCDESDAHQK